MPRVEREKPLTPALSPEYRGEGEEAREPSEAERREAARLTRQSVQLIGQKKWDRAEAVIGQALSLDPTDPVNLYNLACVRARLGKADAAVETLEKAAEAGFTDFVLIGRDPDLDPLRKLPRFQALVARKDEWQRRAAENVVEALRRRFGEDYLYEADFEQKLIFATNVDAQTLEELKQSLKAQAQSQGKELFAHKPDAFVTVVVPSAADYRKLIRVHNVGGAYFDGSKTLIAQRLGEVMRHEFTHALHAADRAPLGQDHAAWFVEGLGVIYETAAMEGDELMPSAQNPRYAVAQAAARRRSLVPLDKLLRMSPQEFLNRPNLTYPQSGVLVFYLRERGVLRKFYDAYKEGFDADPTGGKALEAATGQTLEELEADWVRWLLERDANQDTIDPRRGAAWFLGVRLAPAEGDKGLEVVGLMGTAPAAAPEGDEPEQQRLRVGDVIVAINGRRVNDYAGIRPAVGAYAPGKEVTVRVRRGEQEVDVPVKMTRPVRPAPARPNGGV